MATAIVALAGIAIWGALRSRADFMAKAPLNESLLVLQIFIAAVAIMALVLSAVVAERRNYETALETAKNELEVKVSKRTEQLAERIRIQQRTQEDLRQLSARLLGAQDEERRRIARDLHDSTGQLLTALAINLTMVGDEARGTNPHVDKKVAESIAMAKEISQEVRTISYLLHPPALDEMGLATALQWYVDGFEERSKIKVSLAVPESPERLERDLETALFRVVQECLTNIHRHSGAKTAAIRMEREENRVKLVVEDHGHGMPEGAMDRIAGTGLAGLGLRGMRERVNRFGGEIRMTSNSNGTRIEVTVPARVTLPEGQG
jgi:signal transduction histidine kinase